MTEMTDKEKELEEWLNQVHFGSCCSDVDSAESSCNEQIVSEISLDEEEKSDEYSVQSIMYFIYFYFYLSGAGE